MMDSGVTWAATIVFEPEIAPIFIILIGLVLGFLAFRVYVGAHAKSLLTGKQRFLLLAFRVLAILGICAILFQPMIEESVRRAIAKRAALVAVDTSKSMAEADGEDQATRLDTAKKMIAESGLLESEDVSSQIGEVRWLHFDEDAIVIDPGYLPSLRPKGESTALHTSINTVLGELRPGENGVGLFLFSDGHDFEMVSPRRTGQLARAKHIPIYPVALGKEQLIPDISVSIASYQPHTFIKQIVRIQANLRLLGADSRPLQVELTREGELVRTRKLTVERGYEAPVFFDVSEDTPGQYEYQIRVAPLPGEREVANNASFTYLNVSDAKIPVLLVEGAPHWDTTFLRRTLARNARIELVTVVAMGTGGMKIFGPEDKPAPEKPQSESDFRSYPMVILGRNCERVLDAEASANLANAVREGGVTLVLSRGNPALGNAVFDELAPAPWVESATGPVRVVKSKRRGQFVPMEVLASAPGGTEGLPSLPIAMRTDKLKTLAAVEAMAEGAEGSDRAPAFVHRRHGRGQVLAVAVGGTWKWSLNAKSESSNNVYDRFWNQLVLNLIAQSRGTPNNKSSITMNSANLAVGERVDFTLNLVKGTPPPVSPRITIFRDDKVVTEVPLAQTNEGEPWAGSMVPDQTGRYRGSLRIGTDELECRFAVFAEQRETTEVSTDLPYLRTLAAASGGELLDPGSLRKTIAGLVRMAEAEANAPPITTRRTLWDRTLFFYLLFAILGLEWALRRRWGLT